MREPHLHVDVGETSTAFWLPERESDHVQGTIWKTKAFYESEMLAHAAALLDPGCEVVDVGAYIGNHTLFYANVCKARVVAFEPNPEAFRTLTTNIELNALTKSVTAICAGAGDTPGQAELVHPAKGNAGMCKLKPQSTGDVEVVRLDDQASIVAPSLIKIDVEGMECDVLRGAKKTITTHHPLLYIECARSSHFAQVSALLTDWGYSPLALFNATATICFAHRASVTSVINEQIGYLQYDLRNQFVRLGSQVRAGATATSALATRIDPDLLSKLIARLDPVHQDIALVVERQRHLSSELDMHSATLQSIEQSLKTLTEMHRAAFGSRLARKLRKARRDPRRFLADSPIGGLAKLLRK